MNALSSLPPDLASRRCLGVKDAAAFLGVSVSTLRRLHSNKAVPEAIWPSERRMAWKIGDLTNYIDCRAAGREWQEYKSSLAGNDNSKH